jgi:transglutaminase-like putative cysteine protease
MPPSISPHRIIIFESPEEKAAWLDAGASLDAATPEVRGVASRFVEEAKRVFGKGLLHLARKTFWSFLVEQIARWVRDHIAYARDPGGREEFADSATIIRRAYDDCDGKARLFVALIRAIGAPLRARIRPVMPTIRHRREFVHVQAEVGFPGSELDPRANAEGYLLVELILKGVELGQDPETGPRDAAGHHLIANPHSSYAGPGSGKDVQARDRK